MPIQGLLGFNGYVAEPTNILNVDSRLSEGEGIVSMHLYVKLEASEFSILFVTQSAGPLFVGFITVYSPVQCLVRPRSFKQYLGRL